jgi:general nucleoside transport system permease protein
VRHLPKSVRNFGGWPALAAVFLAVIVGTVLLKACGYSPVAAWSRLFQGALGVNSHWNFADGLGSLIDRPVRLGNSINEAVPLIIVALALAIPFRCGLFNLGGNGQVLMGGLGAALVALLFPPMNPVVCIALSLAAGALFGAVWAVLPGFMKATRGMNEIITTIMLNYVAFWLVGYIVGGPLCDKNGAYGGYPWTAEVPACAVLPHIWDVGRVHLGIVFAVLATIAVHVLMRRSVLGFRMEAAGAAPEAAQFAGYPVVKLQVLSMLFSGLLAGFAGACLLLGVQKRLTDSLDSGFGFDAIAVLLMGRGNPVGIFFAGLFWGCFRTGSEAMEVAENVPKSICHVIQATMLVFLMVFQGGYLRSLLLRRRTLNGMAEHGN